MKTIKVKQSVRNGKIVKAHTRVIKDGKSKSSGSEMASAIFKKGDVLKVNIHNKGVETVVLRSNFNAGISGIQFVELSRKNGGAPYHITSSLLQKSIVKKQQKSPSKKHKH